MFLALLILAAATGAAPTGTIAIDYPSDGSLFPPEITPPTFLWRDADPRATHWRVDISFADGSAAIHTMSRGEHMRVGPIDPLAVAPTNKLPELTPQQAAAHTWKPDGAMWAAVKRHSVRAPATVTFTGLSGSKPVSAGRVTIGTSRDPVGAPIFYRDVPLMPTETEKGVIKPIAPQALPLVKWRLRDIAQPASRVLLTDMPVCANCHSFSRDGKTMGLDLDGLHNNRGLYTLTPVKPETSIGKENVIQWATAAGRLKGSMRVGFMSQVSPDGEYVLTTIHGTGGEPVAPPSNYYVTNFKDYRFLQVFFPTRGILAWYSKTSRILHPLPGADDTRLVQMGSVWSPDGKYVVFARAGAMDPDPPGASPALAANDPHERQMRYDLYRIPFDNGRGGTPEPIAGASANGMSNTFPKVSPDGRWIVFVKSRNGMLIRPDSELYIVPATGGTARRMTSNLGPMNSWHSFSPNGHWLVFSSKRRRPYTQMYLTHIDKDGHDSPAILIDDATASNRAVNLPEFVNVAPASFRAIGGPAIDYYKLFDQAMYFERQRDYVASIAAWKRVLEISPDDEAAESNLGTMLLAAGRRQEAATHVRKANEVRLRDAVIAEPAHAAPRIALGALLIGSGRVEEASAQLEKAVELDPDSAPARTLLAGVRVRQGRPDRALAELRRALELDSRYAPAHYQLGLALAARGDSGRAATEWRTTLEIDPNHAEAHTSLGDALYTQGQTVEALAHWREAIRLRQNDAALVQRLAWVLATSPDRSVRDGREAVALAARAIELSRQPDARAMDTLAAAYAEAGRFADAVATARRAMAEATRERRRELVDAVRKRLALYEAGGAFRDELYTAE